MAVLIAQTATGTSNLASTTVTWPGNTTTGNTIVVVIGNSSSSAGDVSGVTDSQGNVYQKAFTTDNALIGDLEVWYCAGIQGGVTPTITVAYTTGVAAAVIAREYWGLYIPSQNPFDQQASNTGNSNSLSSGPVTTLKQPVELLVGAGLVPLTNTFTVGAGYSNLTTLNGTATVAVAIEDQYTTSGGTPSATFGASGSIQWVCGIVTFLQAPAGTTTSTTTNTTTSTSSTSSSISSTSASSTSASTSLSSTSVSLSSTSSSISSTSSSTSSTSISSTSSSTSISSTSTSISSTSTSSTSTSSTSISTSLSSTSTSFSSTSSSISSTSISQSSTSASSTSSSSSTSTTTLPPPYLTNSFQVVAAAPANAANLAAIMNAYQDSNVSGDDGDYFIQAGTQFVVQEFKSQHQNNTDNIIITWKGRTTESPSISPIFLQIYNLNSTQWETIAEQTVIAADTDFILQGSPATALANYYDSTNTVTARIYQQVV